MADRHHLRDLFGRRRMNYHYADAPTSPAVPNGAGLPPIAAQFSDSEFVSFETGDSTIDEGDSATDF